jgi:tRNA1(Val) A37 N6-methylase TrmN6
VAAPEARVDHLLGGRVALVQPATGYRAAIDPVLLAAAVDAGPDERAVDLGCGVGAAALCLMQRVPALAVIGIDDDPDAVALAEANARRNGRAGFAARRLDILAEPSALSALGPVDHVLTNPPFHPADASDPSPDAGRARATVAGFALADWLAGAARPLGPRGTLTLIHRADRLDDVLAALPKALGGVVVVPLWPRAGEPAKRVLVIAHKGSRAPLSLTAGLVLHRPDGGFTSAADALLRDGAGLGEVVAGAWKARARRRAVAPAS